MNSLEKAKTIAQILDEKKGENIAVIGIEKLSTLGDYFVIASGSNSTQVKSMADEVEFQMKNKHHIVVNKTEGYRSNTWILLDYGDVIVHVFLEETRDFYDLERLWADGEKLDLSDIIKEQ